MDRRADATIAVAASANTAVVRVSSDPRNSITPLGVWAEHVPLAPNGLDVFWIVGVVFDFAA